MQRKRLLILIYAMLICIVSAGCSTSRNISNTEEVSETESEVSETESKVTHRVTEPYIIVKYSEKEIVVSSDITCSFSLNVSICDGDFTSKNTYTDFEISEGETITLTIKDLAPNFFSDKAIIKDAEYNYDIFEYFPGNIQNYKRINANILLKYSDKKVIVYSDKTCLFDLSLYTADPDFESHNYYRGIEISEGETLELTLEDLAPGFFSDNTLIRSCNTNIQSYVEK